MIMLLKCDSEKVVTNMLNDGCTVDMKLVLGVHWENYVITNDRTS